MRRPDTHNLMVGGITTALTGTALVQPHVENLGGGSAPGGGTLYHLSLEIGSRLGPLAFAFDKAPAYNEVPWQVATVAGVMAVSYAATKGVVGAVTGSLPSIPNPFKRHKTHTA